MDFQCRKFGIPQFSTVFKSQIRYFLREIYFLWISSVEMSELEGTHGSRRRFFFPDICHQCPGVGVEEEIPPAHAKTVCHQWFLIPP